MLNTFELLARPEVYFAHRLRSSYDATTSVPSLLRCLRGTRSQMPRFYRSLALAQQPQQVPLNVHEGYPNLLKKLVVVLRGALALPLLLQVRIIPVVPSWLFELLTNSS